MSIFSRIKDRVTAYVDTYVKLMKLNFIEGAAKMVSFFLFVMICLFIVFVTIVFVGFGISESLVALGMSQLGAYFITAGVYLLLLFVFVLSRNGVLRFFGDMVVRMMTEGDGAAAPGAEQSAAGNDAAQQKNNNQPS